jgi:hypothetical protein
MAEQREIRATGGGFPVIALTVVAALSAILAVANFFLVRGNGGLAAEVQERQRAIAEGVELSPLNVQLSQLIGTLAQTSGDIDLRAVLERHGITIAGPAKGLGPESPAGGAGSTR